MLYPQAPVSVMNAGVNGSSATAGYERLKRDVLAFSPDLLVVCFGLNDSNKELEGLETYKASLRNIFTTAKEAGIETIFMTPNMCTDRIDYSIKEKEIHKAAARVEKTVKEGWLDKYIEEAKKVCEEENILVCDCYGMWKRLADSGVDITSILSNKLNHPRKEMHWMFAYELVKTMFK